MRVSVYSEANSSDVLAQLWTRHQANIERRSGNRGKCQMCGAPTPANRSLCSEACRLANKRLRYFKTRDRQLELKRRRDRRGVLDQWAVENRAYAAERARRWRAQAAAELAESATVVRAPWQPHEDALLSRVPSNIAAASALGRTLDAVKCRRAQLRKLEVA